MVLQIVDCCALGIPERVLIFEPMDVKGHTSKTGGRRVDVDCASQDVDVNTRHEDVQSARKAEEAQNELDQMSVHARKAIRAATKRLVR